MISSPLFRPGDVLTSGSSERTRLTVDRVLDGNHAAIYLLSAPFNISYFRLYVFREGKRISQWLCADNQTYLV